MTLRYEEKNRFILGTAQFGQVYGISNKGNALVNSIEIEKILKSAYLNGVTALDTAASYGECERILGMVGVSQFSVQSKLPQLPESAKNVSFWVDQTIANSLEALGRSSLDCLFVHEPADFKSSRGKELASSLEIQKAEGRIKKLGFRFIRKLIFILRKNTSISTQCNCRLILLTSVQSIMN